MGERYLQERLKEYISDFIYKKEKEDTTKVYHSVSICYLIFILETSCQMEPPLEENL